jgi:hypothetical protein
MEQNIIYNLTEDFNRETRVDIDVLYNEYDISDQDKVVDEYMANKLDYSLNYNVNDLKKIIEFYNTHDKNTVKPHKKRKDHMIDAILQYELDINNVFIVNKRKKLWFYIKEIKNDKYLSKYIIFN